MRYRSLVFVVVLMFPSYAVLADDHDAPMYVRLFTAELQPNTQRQYEAVLKKFVAAHKQLDTKRHYFVSTQVIGSPTTYTFASFFRSFAAMDRPPRDVMVEAYSEEEVAEMRASMEGKVLSQATGMWTRRLDLSPTQPENAQPPGMINWLTVTIKPYGNGPYEEYLKKVAEATNQITPDAPFVVWSPGPGANNTYGFANPIASWAAMDETTVVPVPVRLERAFGKREADRLLKQRAEVVESQNMYMSRGRPDLSYIPED